MKRIHLLALLALSVGAARAQNEPPPVPTGFPLTISVFSHSVSLPTFRGFLKKPDIGLRVGTEFYYRNRPGSQLVQTLNVGFYHHRSLQSGLFLNTEFGYRKFIGGFYTEGFVGIGALGLSQQMRSYQRTETGAYQPASRFMLRAMPSLSVGAGYRFGRHTPAPVSVFARYEVFAETPFNNPGIPALPHSALHVGTRILLNP